MSRFYFHIKSPTHSERDEIGLLFGDVESAYLGACDAIPGLAADLLRSGRNPMDYSIFVENDRGELMMRVPFSELVRREEKTPAAVEEGSGADSVTAGATHFRAQQTLVERLWDLDAGASSSLATALLEQFERSLGLSRPDSRRVDASSAKLDGLGFLDTLLADAIALTGADMGNIQLLDPEAGALHIAVSRGFFTPFLRFFAAVGDGRDSSCGSALGAANRVIVPSVERSALFQGKESGAVLNEAGVRAVQSTPILGRNGGIIGMISTHWHAQVTPEPDRLGSLDQLLARSVGRIETAATHWHTFRRS